MREGQVYRPLEKGTLSDCELVVTGAGAADSSIYEQRARIWKATIMLSKSPALLLKFECHSLRPLLFPME